MPAMGVVRYNWWALTLLLGRLARWARSDGGCRHAAHLVGGLAEVEQRTPCVFEEARRFLLHGVGEFVQPLQFFKQLVGLAIDEAGHRALDLGDGLVETGK